MTTNLAVAPRFSPHCFTHYIGALAVACYRDKASNPGLEELGDLEVAALLDTELGNRTGDPVEVIDQERSDQETYLVPIDLGASGRGVVVLRKWYGSRVPAKTVNAAASSRLFAVTLVSAHVAARCFFSGRWKPVDSGSEALFDHFVASLEPSPAEELVSVTRALASATRAVAKLTARLEALTTSSVVTGNSETQ